MFYKTSSIIAKQYGNAGCSKIIMLSLDNQGVLTIRNQVERQAVSASQSKLFQH